MNSAVVEKDYITEGIKEAFAHFRDTTIRDANQSLDGNKIPMNEQDLLAIARAKNEMAKLGKKLGIPMPSSEDWGGGQVAQPARFLGEDPLINMEELHKAMPDVNSMALYRSRQCLGFEPVSPEIQELAYKASMKRGVKVFRVFDMMNDIENIAPSLEILNKLRKEHNADITIEGAISYISAPDKGNRAMTLKEYGDYAVKLAKAGADEITIKNYAGVGDKEMPELIQTIRTHLDEAGHKGMKINLHIHGQKPDVLVAAIKAGASKVDVAIGELSGSVSHTDMRSAIYAYLESKGIDTSQKSTQLVINNHPMMKQLERTEEIISDIVNKPREIDGKTSSFKAKRGVLETITQPQADHYRVAGGAMSDVSGRIDADYAKYGKEGNPPTGFPSKTEYFHRIMEKSLELWEKAGQFNTVTPGALILTQQATKLVTEEINGKKPTLESYTPEYVDIAIGRYGKNRGMEKGLGDTKWADSMMMYRGLKLMNKALNEGKISDKQLTDFIMVAGLGVKNYGENNLTDRVSVRIQDNAKQFNLKDPDLEAKLRNSSIANFRDAIEKSLLDGELKTSIMKELTPGRSTTPTEGIAAGFTKLETLKKEQGIDVAAMHASGHRISAPEDVALLSMLLPKDAFNAMVTAIAKQATVAQLGGGAEEKTFAAAALRSSRAAGGSALLQ